MFKHRSNLTKWFCALGLPLAFFSDIWSVVVAYYFFQVIGISIGLHKMAGHGATVGKFWERIFFISGLMTHAGPLKGSALDHARHHRYADTPDDQRKVGREVNNQSFLSVLPKKEIKSILGRFDKFAYWLDDNYYLWFIPAWLLITIFNPGIIVGAALATFLHNFIFVNVFHMKTGYRNFDTPDKSNNLGWAWPLFLGENWHNNHHGVVSHNSQVKWWELDIPYQILKLFLVKK